MRLLAWLALVLALAGCATLREAGPGEGNRVVRELGTKVDPVKQQVAVDGQRIQVERPVYFAVFKPRGFVSTNNDPSGRPRVIDLLPTLAGDDLAGRLQSLVVALRDPSRDDDVAAVAVRVTNPSR